MTSQQNYPALSPVTISCKDSIAYLTLNAPPGNVMNSTFFTTLANLVANEIRSLNAEGLIITGAGRHFSSGADIEELNQIFSVPSPVAQQKAHDNMACFSALEHLPFPVIASVNGACLGSGLELALAADIRICSPGALFAFAESGFGLMPGCGGTVRGSEALGFPAAAEYILTGTTFGAEEAQRIGLVQSIVEKKEILEYAVNLIRGLRKAGWSRNP